MRPEWVRRWAGAANEEIAGGVRGYAGNRNLTPREVSLAFVLSQPFPTIGIVGLPALLTRRMAEYGRGSAAVVGPGERGMLLAGSAGGGLGPALDGGGRGRVS